MKVRIQFGFAPESRASCHLQIYLPAIEGYVPPDMLRCLQAFLEFCYILRCGFITEIDIEAYEKPLGVFTAAGGLPGRRNLRRVVPTLPARGVSLHPDDTAVRSSERSLFFHYGI
jgi:hypothetical protein